MFLSYMYVMIFIYLVFNEILYKVYNKNIVVKDEMYPSLDIYKFNIDLKEESKSPLLVRVYIDVA
jgi:hypothetical protein